MGKDLLMLVLCKALVVSALVWHSVEPQKPDSFFIFITVFELQFTDNIHKLVTTPTWFRTHNYNTISFATHFNKMYYTANPKLRELFQTLKL